MTYAKSIYDGRLSRNRKPQQIPILDKIAIEIEQRPTAMFDKGMFVVTPMGTMRVTDRYHNSATKAWCYRFIQGQYPKATHYIFSEQHLKPVTFSYSVGQSVQLPSGIKRTIAYCAVSPTGEKIYGLSISDKQTTIYTEAQLLSHNTRFAIGQQLKTPIGYLPRTLIRIDTRDSGPWYGFDISTDKGQLMLKWWHQDTIATLNKG